VDDTPDPLAGAGAGRIPDRKIENVPVSGFARVWRWNASDKGPLPEEIQNGVGVIHADDQCLLMVS